MRIILLISAISFALGFGSCTKIIDVDLNDAAKKMVIEANYVATDSIVRVKVSYTASYFDTYTPSNIDDAVVTITDQNGNTTTIPGVGQGTYVLMNYAPTAGATYSINVTHDGKTYTNTAKLSPQLDILAPNPIFFEQGFFGEPGGYLVFFEFQDPPGVGNYYNLIGQVNDTLYNKPDEFILGDDNLTDGNLLTRPFFFGYYQPGDTITFELQAIDERIFDYYAELQTIAGGQSSAAPANPTYQWTNEALGYFSAYYYTKSGVRITE